MAPKNLDLEQAKDFTIATARLAGKSLVKNFNRIKTIKTKFEGKKRLSSFVTNADVEAEKIVIQRIRQQFPEHNIISEEYGAIDNKSIYTWHIDPLDGTHNYIYGNNLFGVSIALAKGDNSVLGVIYFPIFEEFYYAIRGKGSFSIINGKKTRLKTSNKTTFIETMMIFGSAFYLKQQKIIKTFKQLVENTFRVRIYGSALVNLIHVATGKADFYVDFNTHSWDIAAGALIAEEAGSKITYLDGKPWNLSIKDFVASNNKFHSKILKIINKH